MSHDFGANQDTMKWVVAAYLIGVGALMYPAGVISDSIGHHRTCRCGMVLFLIATALCTLAQSSAHLIGFRVLQGAAAGIVVSPGIALLTTYYEDFREKIAFVMAIGPVLGGIASDYASWRFIFAICIPFVGLATLLLYLSPLKNKSQSVYHDYRALISMTAFSLLVASMSMLMACSLWFTKFFAFLWSINILFRPSTI